MFPSMLPSVMAPRHERWMIQLARTRPPYRKSFCLSSHISASSLLSFLRAHDPSQWPVLQACSLLLPPFRLRLPRRPAANAVTWSSTTLTRTAVFRTAASRTPLPLLRAPSNARRAVGNGTLGRSAVFPNSPLRTTLLLSALANGNGTRAPRLAAKGPTLRRRPRPPPPRSPPRAAATASAT